MASGKMTKTKSTPASVFAHRWLGRSYGDIVLQSGEGVNLLLRCGEGVILKRERAILKKCGGFRTSSQKIKPRGCTPRQILSYSTALVLL